MLFKPRREGSGDARGEAFIPPLEERAEGRGKRRDGRGGVFAGFQPMERDGGRRQGCTHLLFALVQQVIQGAGAQLEQNEHALRLQACPEEADDVGVAQLQRGGCGGRRLREPEGSIGRKRGAGPA